MSDALFLDSFRKLLDGLGADPWPELEASGFLDVLRPEAEGGAGLDLSSLFPLAFECGRRAAPPATRTVAASAQSRAAGSVMRASRV
ncbi:MAG: hypothetical protein ACKOEY_07235, partial [Phenylobacterium sp.]